MLKFLSNLGNRTITAIDSVGSVASTSLARLQEYSQHELAKGRIERAAENVAWEAEQLVSLQKRLNKLAETKVLPETKAAMKAAYDKLYGTQE